MDVFRQGDGGGGGSSVFLLLKDAFVLECGL